MKIVEIETADKVKLFGCVYGENFRDTCVIVTNGTCGNIFENKFLQIVGEKLEQNGISFVYAHNRGAFHRMDTKTPAGTPTGTTYELFDDCLFDLQAYVDWAKNEGFKHIILGGHSYGANKVVYCLSQNQSERVEKYILLSPTDTGRLKDHEQKSETQLLPLALEFEKQGKLDDLLPMPFDNFNLFTARAFLDFLENPHSRNLPIHSQQGDWKQLQQISQTGLFVMGEKDGFAFGDAKHHLETINNNSKHKNNKIKVIENCGHTFSGKEEELAEAILTFAKQPHLPLHPTKNA